MVKKLLWSVVYVGLFALAFIGGLSLNTSNIDILTGSDGSEWDASRGTIERDLSYADGSLNTFDLFLPADADEVTKIVLYIHGGGFTSGDKSDDENAAKYFASKGYVAATINYSLRSDGNSVDVRQMTEEIKAGVESIYEATLDHGFAVDGMVIAGGSAGGNLALTYAYRDGGSGPIPVNAVIALVGPASFEPADWLHLEGGYSSRENAEQGAAFVSVMTGEEVDPALMRSGEYQELLKPISPLLLVTPNAPPTLLAYGELDKLTPFAASEDLPGALEMNDVPHDVILFPNSGHALNRDPERLHALRSKLDDYLNRYAPIGRG